MKQRELGFLIGILVGEAHFGGDQRQPQITLRMHIRHKDLMDWLMKVFPNAKLYGPYHHDGRHYYQWMARGAFLREELVPLIARNHDLLGKHVAGRFDAMCAQYKIT